MLVGIGWIHRCFPRAIKLERERGGARFPRFNITVFTAEEEEEEGFSRKLERVARISRGSSLPVNPSSRLLLSSSTVWEEEETTSDLENSKRMHTRVHGSTVISLVSRLSIFCPSVEKSSLLLPFAFSWLDARTTLLWSRGYKCPGIELKRSELGKKERQLDNRDEGNESANYIYSLFPVRKINNLFIIYRNLSSIEMLLLAPLTPIVYIYIRSLFESAERAKRDLYPWISLGIFPPLCYQSEWSVSIRCGQNQVYGRRERERWKEERLIFIGAVAISRESALVTSRDTVGVLCRSREDRDGKNSYLPLWKTNQLWA